MRRISESVHIYLFFVSLGTPPHVVKQMITRAHKSHFIVKQNCRCQRIVHAFVKILILAVKVVSLFTATLTQSLIGRLCRPEIQNFVCSFCKRTSMCHQDLATHRACAVLFIELQKSYYLNSLSEILFYGHARGH